MVETQTPEDREHAECDRDRGAWLVQAWRMPLVRLAWPGSPLATDRRERRPLPPGQLPDRAARRLRRIVRRAGSASRRVAARSGFSWDPGLPRPGALGTLTRHPSRMFPVPTE